MNIAEVYAVLPTWAIVVIGLVIVALAVRFRAMVCGALAIFSFLAMWHAGDPNPWIGLVLAAVAYGILSAVAGAFSGRDEDGEYPLGKGYDYAREQARISQDYHRRERESRF